MPNDLRTSEGVLLDGANSVSGRSRAGFPGAPATTGLAIAAFAFAAFLLRRGRMRWVAVALLLAALPGATWVVALRGDAPHRRGLLAATIKTAVKRVQHKAPWPKVAAKVLREDDDALFPIGRYALPTRRSLTPRVRIELRGGRLSFDCMHRSEDGVVVCGAQGP